MSRKHVGSPFQRPRLRRAMALATLVLIGFSTGAAMAGYLGSGDFPTRFLSWRFYGTTSANGS